MELDFIERTILGAMLLDQMAVFDAMSRLHSTDFSLSSHQDIFKALERMHAQGRAIDTLTLRAEIGEAKVGGVGGLGYLADLTSGIPRNFDIGEYCRLIKRRSLARRSILVCQRAQNRLVDPLEDPETVLDELSKSFIGERRDESLAAVDIVPGAMHSLEVNADDVISTGIPDLDEMTSGGMRPKELWVIGAQPSGGKSSLARQLERAAILNGAGVHAHSIEVPKEDWLRFHIAHVARVEAWKLRQPWLMSITDKANMREAAAKVSRWPLLIDDAGSVHIRTLISKSRLSCLRKGIRVYTIDYLQMLNGDHQEIRHRTSDAVRGLKQFAKDNNVVVVLLSQMARRGDVNSRPSLQDLKESGDIEAAADVAILNYRPKLHDQYTGMDELIVAKQRNGPVGPIPVTYRDTTLTFEART